MFQIQYFTLGLTILYDTSVGNTIFHIWFVISPWQVGLRYKITHLVCHFSMTGWFEIQDYTFGLSFLQNISVWDTKFHLWFGDSLWHVSLRYNISSLVWEFSMTCLFEIQYFTFGLTILYDRWVWDTRLHIWFVIPPEHICLRNNISPLVWQFSMTYLFEKKYFFFGLTILSDISVWDTILHIWFDNSFWLWYVRFRYNTSESVFPSSITCCLKFNITHSDVCHSLSRACLRHTIL